MAKRRLHPLGAVGVSFHLLRHRSPLLQGYWDLRSAIFCREQHLFEASDRDDHDGIAYPIAAINHAHLP